jgi:hypothetical protein
MTSITINEQNTTASSTDVRELWDLAEKKHLAGGRPTPLKNMKVSWDYCSHILWKIKCSKPPTRHVQVPKLKSFNHFLSGQAGGAKREASSDSHHDILF